jgi:cell division protease FtsH
LKGRNADEASATRSVPDAQPRRTTPWREEGTRDKGVIAWLRPARRRVLVAVLLAVLGLNWYLGSKVTEPEQPAEVPYTVFRAEVKAGNVRSVNSILDEIEGTFKTPVRYPEGSGERMARFQTLRPSFDDSHLLALLERNGVEVRAERPKGRPLWQILALSFGPTLLLVLLFVWLIRRTGAFRSMSLGTSRATRYTADEGRATFDDVAGIEESKAELVEIVDFLRDPEHYWELGAAIPRGVLLSGPPGTGKTLLARAVAGQADVPFFSLSGSEFIELVVGVGASRVRDLFRQAKENAPAIIFIDELDAVGRSRSGDGGLGGGHAEREQTLNQILTEMDGFARTDGVIVIAATNRPEILDAALLRPGRFDRRVVVSAPDQTGRREILNVHTRGVPLADDVDLGRIASATPGMVGADLRNLVNEAALQAARLRQDKVTARDFGDALEKVVLGTERHITITDEERRRTAYHEAGHALLGMLDPKADAIRKVSIVPRGQALGVTFQSPDVDRYGYESGYLKSRIIGALGGRAAEDLVLDSITSGAENDLEIVTQIARQMVGRWGMSDAVGPVSVLPRPGQPEYPGMRGTASEGTRQLVDAEVRRLIDECYSVALGTLHDNRGRLDKLAQALLENETLDGDEAYIAAGFISPNGGGPTAAEVGGAPPAEDRPAAARARGPLRPL